MEAHLDLAMVHSFGEIRQTHNHLFLPIVPLFDLIKHQLCAILPRLLQSSLESRPSNLSRIIPRPPFDEGLPLLLGFYLLNEKKSFLFLYAKVLGNILPGLDDISL